MILAQVIEAVVSSVLSVAFVSAATPPPKPSSPVPSTQSSSSPSPPAFWKSEDVYRRIKEERAVIVSAKTVEDHGIKKLTLISAGIIHAPESFTHSKITEYKDFKEFVPYIEESSFDKSTQNIFLHGALMGYHVKMTIHVKAEETQKGHLINWESVSGGFQGMKGSINEERVDSEHTEISLTSSFSAMNLGIPGFIISWGLEYAGQRASTAMRSHVEEEWEKSKNH